MPPKTQFTKEAIIDAGFAIAREEGTPHITARAIASRLNCSTSPIYSHFSSMDELEDELSKRFANLLMQYITADKTGSRLTDMALGYILFARDEQMLFRFTYMNRKTMRPIALQMIEQNTSLLAQSLKGIPELSGLSSGQIRELIKIGWAFSHGVAAQFSIGLLNFSEEGEIIAMIERVKTPLIEKMKQENKSKKRP